MEGIFKGDQRRENLETQENLESFLFRKIKEIERRVNTKKDSKSFARETEIRLNEIFNLFLDFSENRSEKYRVDVIEKLNDLLKDAGLYLPSAFKKHLLERGKDPQESNFISKLDSQEFDPFFDRYDDDLMLEDEPDFAGTRGRTNKRELRDRLEDDFRPEEIEKINGLANKIYEFTLKSDSFMLGRFLNFEGRAYRFITKLFKNKSSPVSKELLVESINEAVKCIMTMPGSSDEEKDKKLIKKAQILGNIAIIIKLHW